MKEPLTIKDFQNGWLALVQKEDEEKVMPIHPFGSFRMRSGGLSYCKACERHYEKQNQWKYSSLCCGKRKWWFFGRWKCPRTPHFHVKCTICNATHFEGMHTKKEV